MGDREDGAVYQVRDRMEGEGYQVGDRGKEQEIRWYTGGKGHEIRCEAKIWNGPGWDKVGIEFTESQLDPNFLPSLALTNHPSVLVDISIFFYLNEILNKK